MMPTDNDGGYKVYPARWTILIGYSISSLLNAYLWISFASIDDATAAFYHVDTDKVNWLAIVFQVLYFPGMLLCLYALAATDLRFTMLLGTGIGLVGALLRTLSAFVAVSDPGLGYWLCMAGQVLGALAQPIFLSTPAIVAANWFPVSERDLAVTVGALFNPLGNAVGQVVPPFVVVVDGGSDDDAAGPINPADVAAPMQRLQAGVAAFLLVSFLWTMCVFKSHPPTPPSKSTADRIRNTAAARQRRSEQHADLMRSSGAGVSLPGSPHGSLSVAASGGAGGGGGDETPAEVLAQLFSNFRVLLRDRNFLLLLTTFSFGLAVFNALLTVIAQMLGPYGYDNDEAGIAGGVLIFSGLIGAGITAGLLDTYHCYREVLKGAFVAVFGALTLICVILRWGGGSFGLLLVGFGVMGLFTLPILPGVIENAVEATYPIPEEASSGLLFGCGNVLGIGFTVVLARLVKGDHSNEFFSPAAVFLLGTVGFCVLVALPYDGEYKRLAAEKDKHGGGGGGERQGSKDSATGVDTGGLKSPLLGGQADGADGDVPPSPPHDGRSPGSARSGSSFNSLVV